MIKRGDVAPTEMFILKSGRVDVLLSLESPPVSPCLPLHRQSPLAKDTQLDLGTGGGPWRRRVVWRSGPDV